MNNFYEPQNEFENEITMSQEEIKSHKGIFSKLCFSLVIYLAVVEGCALIFSLAMKAFYPDLLKSTTVTLIMSLFIQYVIGFPVFCHIIKKIPKSPPQMSGERLSVKKAISTAAICLFFIYVGNYISEVIMIAIGNLMGDVPESSIDELLQSSNIWVSLLIVGIIGPIIEEFMFRKLFIDRLTPYGQGIAVFFPALLFGLFHANLYQFFYAFMVGVIFSYIYVKTGKISYTISLHIFINVFSGVIPAAIFSKLDMEQFLELSASGNITEEFIEANSTPLMLLGLYEIVMFGLIFVGIFAFNKMTRRRSIYFEKGAVRFPKGVGLDVVLFNAGAIILIALCLFMTAFNTFAI